MAPPELAADAPVPLFGQPVEIRRAVAFVGMEGDAPAGRRPPHPARGVHRGLCQPRGRELVRGAAAAHHAAVHVAHAHEPLLGQIRLDGRLGAVRVADLDCAVFDVRQQTQILQIPDDLLARGETVEPLVRPGHVVEGTVRGEDVEDADCRRVSRPHLVVVRVVAGRDLDAPAAEFRLGPCVADERNRPVEQRQADHAAVPRHIGQSFQALQVRLAAVFQPRKFGFERGFVFFPGAGRPLPRSGDQLVQGGARVGMAGDRGIAQHGLGPRRGDDDVGGLARPRVDHRIAQMPEVALHGFVHDLVVRHRGLQMTVPIDQPRAAKDQPVPKQPEEGPLHRARADRVHGEALTIPVARTAHGLLLADDARLILFLPIPDALHERLAADVVARLAFQFEQPFLHHRLRRNAGVVGAGHPERIVARHAVPARQQILHDVVHGVPHVERARHVGQRHHDDVAPPVVVGRRGKGLGLGPLPGDRAFQPGRVVLGCQLVRHVRALPAFLRISATEPKCSRRIVVGGNDGRVIAVSQEKGASLGE